MTNIYKKIVVNNINLDNIDKILMNYVEEHNKKFDIYIIKCSFNIKIDDDIYELDTVFVYNIDIYKIVIQLLFYIDMIESEGKNFINIDQMTVIIHSDICNMTEEYSKYMRKNPIERQINIIFGKNPNLLNNISNNI